ncbi:PAS domain S-box protein [Desulfonatronovibrio hydrogenovorans]|uniref:PAS domain S-box protein n=1 Tax=Desulfonatronovibrio hydrogenovorans TaxID=53245 RepID=UPI00068B77E1|nr:PAS domain S-box protein [Desulfonatronovibrio hydrogenovorans]
MKKILIVEDDQTARTILKKTVQKHGYEVCAEAGTGDEAIKSIARQPPDVVLMDIMLPGEMDGIEAAGIIRNNWSIPVIFISALYDEHTIQRAAETLPYAYLRKPVESGQLVAEIDLALRRKQKEAELELKRRTVENKLKDSEEKFRRLSQDMPIMVCTFHKDSTLYFVNNAYCDFFGKSADELIGRTWHDLLPAEVKAEAHKRLNKLTRENPIDYYEFAATRPDGSVGWQKWTARAMYDGNGEFLYYQAIGEDTTSRNRALMGLEENERILNSVLQAINVSLVVVDIESRKIVRLNEEAEKLFKDNDLLGKDYDQVVRKVFDGQELGFDFCTECLPVYHKEIKLKDHAGEVVPVSFCAFEEEFQQKKSVVLIFHDISERKSLEMQLAHAQKLEAVGELAAGIAHEINTPAQYVGDNTRFLKDVFEDIMGLVDEYDTIVRELLDRDLVKNLDAARERADYDFLVSEVPRSIEQSLQGLERISTIVKAMKKFSHPGERDEMTYFDLRDSLENTIAICRNEWKYVAEVKTSFPPDLPGIRGYPHDLNQVFLNLIVNAAQAIKEKVQGTDEKGLIKVRVGVAEGYVEIQIEDTGAGIPAKYQDRVFNQFFTTKPVGKGTGQGLAIAYSIVVDKHGGSITFDSTPGQGTLFSVRIPQP